MDSSQVKAAFIRLKPLCDAFLGTPSKATLQQLTKEWKGLKPCILQEVHAYVLFPFTVHLRKHHLIKPSELKMLMVQAVNEIFSKTHVDSVEMYFKYFYLMIIQIFDKDSLETATLDEDFTLCVVRTITTVTLRIPHEVRFKLYTRSNATKLGQGIYVCVQLARKYQYKALRLGSIHCILAICTLHDDLMGELHTPTFNAQLAECVGDVLMFFLPGLLGAMQDIAKGDHKQAHAITCLAIKTISRVLCLTMMDRVDKKAGEITSEDFMKLVESCRSTDNGEVKEKPDPFGIKLRAKGVEGMKKHLQKAERNKDWYDAAGEKLTLLMKSLLSVQYHPHEKVRKEAALMCLNIVTYCPKNMYPSMKYILEMLIASLEDNSAEVSKISKEALQNFTINNAQNNRKRLLDILEDNFSTVLTKLPRYLNQLDSDLQFCGIRLFKGYVRLMTDPGSSPQRLTQILSCTHVMNRFAIILVQIFKLECSNVQLIEKFTLKDVETLPSCNYMWNINYSNLHEECVASAMDICKIVGGSEALEIMIDYFLDQYRLDNECKKEIIFIFNELLTAPNPNKALSEHLIRNVINTYIDNDNWYLPITVNKKERIPTKAETLDKTIYNPHEPTTTRTFDLYEGTTETRYTDVSYRQSENIRGDYSENVDEKYCQNQAQAQNNIIQVCLMTEGIGKIAKFMGESFQPYLLKTLYLILERAASNVEMIQVAGVRALNDIAEAFHLKNISELIKTNADYFTHHINMKLKKLYVNSDVLDVLLIVMLYSEVDVLMCLYNIVANVLDQSHKSYSIGNSMLFLKLFYAFIIHISSKYPTTDIKTNTNGVLNNKHQSNSVLYVIKEYHNNLKTSSQFKQSPVEANGIDHEKYIEEDCNDMMADEKKVVPPHISMVVSVLKRTLNYLPSNDRTQKLLAIEILKEGIFFIREWEDEVLPLIHKIWSPLVHRFKESSQPIVINKALRLLVTFAQISKDFIRHRTTEEVIPILCEFLLRTAKDSCMKDVGSSYRYNQAYKLQLAILENIGEIGVLLNVPEKVIYNIMNAACLYLNSKQPKPLQMASVETFKKLGSHNLGIVWIHLNGLWNESRTDALHKKMRSHNVREFRCSLADQSEISEFKTNVNVLLDHLENKNSK